ncbi:MAG: DUF711 family protein [Anaerolineaceae bacterium]|nr:DUF711 family protein [Anaerolineaceae bacterium]
MKIRSITSFYDPGILKADYTLEVLSNLAKECRQTCNENGYEVQTVRLATIPFSLIKPDENNDQLIKLTKIMETKAKLNGFDYLSLGPALIGQPESYEVISDLISETDITFFSGIIADQRTGVSIKAIQQCAKIISKNAIVEENGFANLRFSALANVKPFGPFFPGSYHHPGQPPTISIAVEGADEVIHAFSSAKNLLEARKILLENLERHANQLGLIFSELLADQKVVFQGFDFSVAPFPKDSCSLGAAMESLGVSSLGKHGSLAAAAFLADTLDRGNWARCGFNGLMLPLLEDSRLSQRSIDQTLTIKDLLMYSAVCGTGLDTIPIPGSTTREQIEALLLDIAALSSRLNKPLTARLMPIPGKEAGDLTNFDFEFFSNGRVLAIDANSLTGYFNNSNEGFKLRPRQVDTI